MQISTSLVVLFTLSFYLFIGPNDLNASNRVALVIGNSEYQTEPLRTPANDAKSVGDVLSRIGFEVTLLINADRREMLEGINSFADNLKKAEIGLVFYAGHAIQIKGVNYLIPLKADIRSALDLEYEALQVNRIVDKMSEVDNRLNVVILDACRKNPLLDILNSADQGLAPMELPPDTIIAYASLPGSTADHGTGRNSVFTKSLLHALENRKLTVRNLFDAVRVGVMQETNRKQIPWTQYSPMEPICLSGEKPSNLEESGSSTQEEQTGTIKDNEGGETQWGWLEVNPHPLDAEVRVLNIGPKYQTGMKLPTGSYHIEIRKAGYKTVRRWVELSSEEYASYEIELDKEQSNSEPKSPSGNQHKVVESKKDVDKLNVTITDSNSRLIWAGKDNGRDITWGAAVAYCDSLTLDQYSNWRMPSSDELKAFFKSDTGKNITSSGESIWSSSQKIKTAVRFEILTRKTFKSLKTNSIDIRVLCVHQIN